MQSLEQKEWEKRVSLERENTELQEKLATMERSAALVRITCICMDMTHAMCIPQS